MNSSLYVLMQAGVIPAVSYYFSRFITASTQQTESGLLALTAALVSERNICGDVCIDLNEYANKPLFRSLNAELSIPLAPSVEDWISELKKQNWVGQAGETAPLILDGQQLYLGKYWHYEHTLAQSILKRCQLEPDINKTQLKKSLSQLFPITNKHEVLTQSNTSRKWDGQKLAAAISCTQSFSVISGGPGTGKTTTVSKVLALLLEQCPTLKIALVAPTGKAAARLSESITKAKMKLEFAPDIVDKIPEQTMTIHRLLQYRQGRFQFNANNQLFIDCLLLDEASMVDLPLMTKLIQAVPDNARIILLGDRDQLASVEAGKVLGDISGRSDIPQYSQQQLDILKELDVLPIEVNGQQTHVSPVSDSIATLTQSYRFNEQSGIGQLAKNVNAGNGNQAYTYALDPLYEDIEWNELDINAKPESSYLSWALEHYRDYLQYSDIHQAMDSFEKNRILAALQEGEYGVKSINQNIESFLHTRGLIESVQYYHGKPIMIIENDYEMGLFNGDTGLIWQVEGEGLFAFFLTEEGAYRRLPLRQLPAHVTAFAITVHKSQGSEFENVLLLLPDSESSILTRELIYTGITRAKKHLTITANPDVFTLACQRRVERHSGLAARLGWQNLNINNAIV